MSNAEGGGSSKETDEENGESEREVGLVERVIEDSCQIPSNDEACSANETLRPTTSGKEPEKIEQDGEASEGTNAEGSSNADQRISESSETTVDNDVGFARRRRSVGRQYRRRSGADESSEEDAMSSDDSEWLPSRGPYQHLQHLLSRSSSDSSNNLSMECQASEDDKPTPKVLLKCKPKHKWFAMREIVGRETGWSARFQGPERFQHRYYGSLHAVQRLELMYKLDEHRGCVNSLNFNRSGQLLASASDDKRVVLWDWAADRSILSFDSGHSGNVFQAKFLPLSGDRHIVTCARDGQVRLSVLSGMGVCKGTRLLAHHQRPTHKLAIHPNTPHEFLSAGEDGLILSHDVRSNKSHRVTIVKEASKKVGLYSIQSNPAFSDEFIVTGEDQYIRLYDRRKISNGVPLKKFCPVHLLKSDSLLHVTCAVFNCNGTEVIGSYNDDDIYLFDTRLPPGTDYQHKYEGHRNSMTVKGVNFFGPRSEFIVSGSDCGNIFFWDKSTEAIVQWMRGDEDGVVNCLEPHPQVPIIATSGLDYDIKIWVPSCEQEPTLKGLRSALENPRRQKIRGLKPLVQSRGFETVIGNQGNREHYRSRTSDPFDHRQMRWLWQQIQRFERIRGAPNTSTTRGEGEGGEPGSSPGQAVSSTSNSSDEEADGVRPQCTPS
ncbi:DDB1- and CUL4-associated factor 8-like isoform X2 [Macrosteles quadrilineatus]|nr:DDB1- and CUL4-associated factor 8-like isoform X2 [Macrosteles quadrilineatus]